MDAAGWLYVPITALPASNAASRRAARLPAGIRQHRGRVPEQRRLINRWADRTTSFVLIAGVADNSVHATAASGRCESEWLLGLDRLVRRGFDQEDRRSGQGHLAWSIASSPDNRPLGSGAAAAANPDPGDRHRYDERFRSPGWSASAGHRLQRVIVTTQGAIDHRDIIHVAGSPPPPRTLSVSALDAAGESGRSAAVSARPASTSRNSQKVSASALGHYLAGRITSRSICSSDRNTAIWRVSRCTCAARPGRTHRPAGRCTDVSTFFFAKCSRAVVTFAACCPLRELDQDLGFREKKSGNVSASGPQVGEFVQVEPHRYSVKLAR